MEAIQLFKSLTRAQRNTFVACFLGWTLDAFDFFLLTFVLVPVAHEFGRTIPQVAFAITLTLMMRPLGAFIFGFLGDKFGRRVPLMIDIVFYSVMELLTAFAPNFTIFLILRALFGIGMGGEWGLGASLAMESLPTKARGLFSGILQQGYAFGYLLAALVYWVVFPIFGWRGLFVAGALPALLVICIRARVPESPVWERDRAQKQARPFQLSAFIKQHGGLFVYAALLMTAFNYMSHGTQDLYATFLEKQRGFGVSAKSMISIVYAVGAICGGTVIGFLSQKWGRRRSIILSATCGMLLIPVWIFAPNTALLIVGYLVKAKVKSGREPELIRAIDQKTLGRGSIAGDEYLHNMRQARVDKSGVATWVETCFCDPPLEEERPYWEKYFDLLKVIDAHSRRNCRHENGTEAWACCDCDCTNKLEARLRQQGGSFLQMLSASNSAT